MARVGVSITKSIAFRNSTQEFSNVYYFENGGALPDSTAASNLIDAIVTIEKTFHSTTVTFLRGRCWSAGGTPSSNEMINQHTLSGTGARATVSGLDKERAFLFRLRAGNDSRGNPVYLRKWFHACGVFYTGQSVTSSILDQSAGFTGTDKTTMSGAVDNLKAISIGGVVYNLVAKSGRTPTSGANFVSHDFLEHHQLGDQWRAQ